MPRFMKILVIISGISILITDNRRDMKKTATN